MSRIVQGVLFVSATLALSVKQVDLLGWDDADYIRMVSCLNHAILDGAGSEFLSCEKGIYKAPLFVNVFVLLYPLILVLKVIGILTPVLEINIYIFFLSSITLMLFAALYHGIKSSKMKLLFTLGAIVLFRNYQYLFMTDVLSALLCGIIFMYYLNVTRDKFQKDVQIDSAYLWRVSILVTVCLGIRTTTAPMVLVLISLFFIDTQKEGGKSRIIKTLVSLFAPIVVFSLLAVFLWKPLLPSAIDMFIGNQSKYFAEWNSDTLVQTLKEVYSIYWIAALVIVIMIVVLTKSGVTLRELLAVCWIPSTFILFFGISGTKDPRFLVWPIFTMIAGLAFAGKPEIHRVRDSILSKKNSSLVLVIYVLILSSLTTPWKSSLGLEKALAVYSHIRNDNGRFCPLSDSPNLNISKVLLIDELQGGKKDLNSRVVNIPDQKMQGSSQEEALDLIQGCTFWYSEDAVESGTQKNEWLGDFQLFLEANYWKKNQGLTFYK
jgi:hypothetical protein